MKNAKKKIPQPVTTGPEAVTKPAADQSTNPVELTKPSPTGLVKNAIDARAPEEDAKVVSKELSPEQQKRRAELEKIVHECLPAVLKVCSALDEIKRDELFRPFETFQLYCASQFHLAKSTSYAYAKAGHKLQLIQSSGEDQLPQNEAQLRPLLDLNDDQALKVWRAAVELAGTGVLSEGIVRKARGQIIERPVQEFKVKEEATKLRLTVRHVWDKCPPEGRSFLIDDLVAFVSALREEMDRATKEARKSAD